MTSYTLTVPVKFTKDGKEQTTFRPALLHGSGVKC